MCLVFEELEVLEPVRREDIPREIKSLSSQLFTIKKFKSDGVHNKFKSRLMLHGNEQDVLL